MTIFDFDNYMNTYEGISKMIKNYSYSEIIQVVSESFGVEVSYIEKCPMGGYSKGKLSGQYKFVLLDLIRNICRYDKVYSMLEDDESRRVFLCLIKFRIYPDIRFIKDAYDSENHQYFDHNIVHCDENEVFVDCGGFIGDTTEDFITQYREYKKIFVYEPSEDNIDICRKNLSTYGNVFVRNAGVGEKKTRLSIEDSKSSSSFMGVSEDNEKKVDVISLDEDILEPISLIKMDIEGFEISALIGAKNHIRNDNPKLAVCVYHIVSDIWEIPLLIHTINPHYRYYIRHYREDENWETVVYAIPKNDNKINNSNNFKIKEHKRAAVIHYGDGWRNFHLTKDCGLVPYLLHKNHAFDSFMVSPEIDNYEYLDSSVKGLKMEYLEDGNEETKQKYIIENAKYIDLLILLGPYDSYYNIVPLYKTLNPDGKIYMALDANSAWMDRIQWDSEITTTLLDKCDVIATSCSSMQKHLNEKWPWKVYCLPNGYYNISNQDNKICYENKRNIILTVGRLGTRQKATEVLLNAFGLANQKNTDWVLRLVGSVEPDFKDYIDMFMEKYPYLEDKIVFVGFVSDKKILREEYANAKIFAMPSRWEGGSPNVISEALNAGCVTAVTKFDAYEDAIGFGKCGMAADIDDISGYSDILIQLMNGDLKKMSENAVNWCSEFFNMERIVARLNELLYGGEE